MTRLYLTLVMCLVVPSALGQELCLLSYELTVSPFDGSDQYRSQIDSRAFPVSRPNRRVSIPACSGRYACDIFIAETEDSKGRLGITITEYDSPDTPTSIVSEIDTTVDFSLGVSGEFEAPTVSALIRLDFMVEPALDGTSKGSTMEPTFSVSENQIRAVHYYSDGKFLGARLYPGQVAKEFLKLDVRPGDIVLGFNAYMAVDESFVDLLRMSILAKQVTSLVVSRNGELIEIQVE